MKSVRNVSLLFLLLVMGGLLWGCSETKVDDRSTDQQLIDKDNQLLQYFIGNNSGKPVIKWAQSDLNNDGLEDLVVIYQVGKEKNMMQVILHDDGDFITTNEVPAPVSNQLITFKNIDKKSPMEFIVQGMKGTKIGYAIFRVEGESLIDLFGEGMEDCC